MNKNNMDKIFQEKFRDFAEVPDEKVWKSISNSLDQKKKSRRMVPLWWKLAGAAALIAILFLIVNPFGEPVTGDVDITDREQPESPATRNKPAEKETYTSPDAELEESLTATEGTEKAIPEGNEDEGGDVPDSSTRRSRLLPTTGSINGADETRITDNSKSRVAGEEAGKVTNQGVSQDVREGLAQAEQEVSGQEDLSLTDPSVMAKAEESLAQEEPARKDITEDGADGKKSIFDEISDEGEEIADASEGTRWSLGARVAPVYFGSMGEGSPIHPNFVANSKSGNVNLSYGLAVSYEVTPKLSVRSGVNKVDYGYDTNDILFTSSLAASTQVNLTNIDYALASRNLVVQSLSDAEGTPDIILNNSKEVAGPEPSQSGRMVQQFGYLEIPLELNYTLLESKLGINLIGGVSSLFLLDNSVTLQSNSGATQIGEANNINSLNFSTNVGFGINYLLTQKIQLSVEPMFKYQLDTFSDSSGDFQPFSIGVYSGLNFKF